MILVGATNINDVIMQIKIHNENKFYNSVILGDAK